VRVGARFDGRLRAGAPVPQRGLTVAEVAANVRYFTVQREGPRSRAVTRLVLSGVSEADEALAEVVRQARSHHIEHVVVHCADDAAAVAGGPLGAVADEVVAALSTTSAAPCPAGMTASIALTAEALADLPRLVARAAAARRLVFTWPFPVPGAPPPPPAAACVGALMALPPRAGGWAVKGLPPCVWPGGAAPFVPWRTSNRFYVDADHQLAQALVFFPDVVRWAKPDTCRRCAVDVQCDGVVGAWLDRGLLPPLEPLEPPNA